MGKQKFHWRCRAVFLACLGMLCAFAGANAQMRGELCSKLDPNNPAKRNVGTILQSNEDFYKMLLDGGERVILDARDYEPCAPTGTVTPRTEADKKGQDKPTVTKSRDDTGGIDRTSSDTLTMLGSGTIGRGVIPKLVDSFAGFRGARVSTTYAGDTQTYAISEPDGTKPFLTITVTLSGSKTSLPALIDRKTPVGMTSVQYTDEQSETLLRLRGLSSRSEVEHVLALDGIMLVVHPNNPIRALDLCDAAKIFAGKTRYWPAGGPEKPIEVHSTYLSSGTFEVFKDLVMDRCHEQLGPAVLFHTGQPDVRAAVEANPSAIGFLGKSEVSATVKTLSIGGRCGVEVAPTSFNIKSEDYLLSRRLYLYTPYKVGKNAESFLNFALHNIEAQEALRGGSTTNQTVETAPQDERLRLAASLPENKDELFPIFRRDVSGSERASISFRFQFGSDKLDTKAQADVLRLVSYLQIMRPRQILLAGFTDDVGSVIQNRRLAENRAQAVRAAIARIDPSLLKNIEVKGYGKILPVTCNDSDLGRYKNRRVEIWLRA